MADIKKELNDIKNAVYGKEVRGSIHDGIKKINDEAENATDLSESAKHQVENIQQQVNQLVVEGDSSVEAAQARVTADGRVFDTLRDRLNYTDTQLAQIPQQINDAVTPKADITYVDDRIASLDGLEFKGAFDTVQELESTHPNGTNGLFVIHADNHWYYWNGNQWTKGNELTTTPWSEFMTVQDEEWVI